MQSDEVNLFQRGMVPLVGFKSTSVCYECHERMAGQPHYPFSKMVALAGDGITSLSVKPTAHRLGEGMVVLLASLVANVWLLVRRATGATVTDWASTTAAVCFMGVIQTLLLGVIGECAGKVYMESKLRPRSIVSRRTWEKGNI